MIIFILFLSLNIYSDLAIFVLITISTIGTLDNFSKSTIILRKDNMVLFWKTKVEFNDMKDITIEDGKRNLKIIKVNLKSNKEYKLISIDEYEMGLWINKMKPLVNIKFI